MVNQNLLLYSKKDSDLKELHVPENSPFFFINIFIPIPANTKTINPNEIKNKLKKLSIVIKLYAKL